MKESLKFLQVPAPFAGASWAFILAVAVFGQNASADWISDNVGGAFLVALPSTLLVVGGLGILAFDAVSRRIRTQK